MERGGRNRSAVGRVVVVVLVLALILPVSFIITVGEQEDSREILEQQSKNFYEQNPVIKLGGLEFDVTVGPQLPDELSIESYDERIDGYYIVQFDGPVTENQKARVKQLGGALGSYIPYNAFVVMMNAETKAQVENLDFVQYVGIYQPAYKFSNDMIENVNLRSDLVVADAVEYINFEYLWQMSKVIGRDDRTTVNIITHEGENPYSVAALIGKAGGNVLDISETGNSVKAEVSKQGIQILSFLNDVEYIMPYYLPVPCLATANVWEQNKVAGQTPIWDEGIHGEGIIVGSADTGLDTDHVMFRDPAWPGPSDWIGWSGPGYPGYPQGHRKVIRYEQWADNNVDESASQHGTHIAGYACGNGDYVGDANANRFGMAYEAKISYHDVGASDGSLSGIPADLKEVYQIQHDDGATLSAITWGIACINQATGERTYTEGTYTDHAMNSDWFTWDNKDFLIFFGGCGDRMAPTAGGPPYNTTLRPPSTAKNGVCVAAHESGVNWENIESYSSWGPTLGPSGSASDGRLKPDLASDGQNVVSAAGDTNRDGNQDSGFSGMTGSSVASPIAMGSGALVAQYYQDGYWPVTASSPVAANQFTPSAALVKASLINGARDSTSGSYANVHDYVLNGHSMDYPNCDQGWGITDIGDSLYFYSELNGREMEIDDNQVGLITNQYKEYEFYVEDSADPLEITLVWSDYKGTISTFGALVNDLELTVTQPNGMTTYFGNNYGASSRQSDSTNPAGRDHVNNVECVLVTSPPTGMWTVRVEASNIPVGPQPYALVLTGDFGNNYGWVKFDKHVYNDGDTVQIEVKDTDESGSVTVVLVSTTGDRETLILNEVAVNARRFEETITTDLLDPVSENGFISVGNGGHLTVFYNETTPFHSSVARASIDVTNPMIWNVHVTDITNTAAVVHWTTDVPATGQVYYGPTTALGASTPLDSALVFAHSVLVSGLNSMTQYYFDVESTSLGGVTTRDNRSGVHYGFTTLDDPDVLIVIECYDVEFSEACANDWRLSLDYYGWSYVVWETVKFGLPSVAALNTAKAVFWDPGEGYPQLGSDERAVLQSWMDQPGQQKLFVTGQDIGWDMCDAAGTDRDVTWYQTYLHARFAGDNADGSGYHEDHPPFQIIGTAHPISSTFPGVGVGLDLEEDVYGIFHPDDLINDQGGQVPFPWDYNKHEDGGYCGATAYNGTDFKTVYEGFTHYMIQPDGTFNTPLHMFGQDVDYGRATVTDETLKWLFGEDHPDITVDYPNGGETVSGVANIQWTATNANTVDVLISRDGGQVYETVASGIPAVPNNWNWDTTTAGVYGPDLDFPNGEFYRVKVIGYGTQLKGFDISDTNFTVQNGGGDDLGPVIWAGSVKPSPIPVSRGAFLNVTAIADDRYRGNSDIDTVEIYIDGTTPAELVGLMTPTDGLFDAPLEDAEIDITIHAGHSLGNHTLYVRARDYFNNWGPFESAEFHVLSGWPEYHADLTYPDGGELWKGGSSQMIYWNMSFYCHQIEDLIVDLTYSTDGGATYPNIIATGLTGLPGPTCSYAWDPVDLVDSALVRIKVFVTDAESDTAEDTSEANFTIDSTAPAPATNVHAELEGTGVRIYWDASVSTDVDRYEVWWRMNAFDPTGDTYTSNFTVFPPITDVLHAGVGIINPSSYTYQLRTFDNVGHETRTLIQAAKYGSTQSVLTRDPDWFLLGCPLPQSNTSVEHVLQGQGMPANIDILRLFRNGTWLSWSPHWPPSLNTLKDIYTNEAFWMHISSSTRYTLAGYVEDKAIPMYSGWNMVAYPFAARSTNTATIMAHLAANCPGYLQMLIEDVTAPYHWKVPTGTETINHNQAFAIYVTSDTTWTVLNY